VELIRWTRDERDIDRRHGEVFIGFMKKEKKKLLVLVLKQIYIVI
jgi:hypothetical protein